jgi:hypothetical protein
MITNLFESAPPEPNAVPNVQNEQPLPPAEQPANQPDNGQDGDENDDSDGDDDQSPPTTQTSAGDKITATGDAKEVEVVTINWLEDEDGYITFLGMLKNNGNKDLVFVELSFTLRDENGTPVTSNYTYASLDILPPGGTTPFAMYFYEPPYDPWVNYEIIIEGDVNEYFDYYTELEVVSSTLQTGSFGHDIVGEIKNTGSQKVDFVTVYAAIYDKDDQLIAVDFTFADEDIISPGGTSTFTLSIWDTLGDLEPDHYVLYLEGNPSE